MFSVFHRTASGGCDERGDASLLNCRIGKNGGGFGEYQPLPTNQNTKMKTSKLVLALVLTAMAWSAQAVDVTGKWVGEFESQVGHQKYVFNFEGSGDKLKATADAESEQGKRQVTFTEVKLTDNTLSFVEMRQIQDNSIRIEYTGKVGTNEIQFTRKVGDFGSQEFPAKREAAPATPAATDISGSWHAEFDTQIGMQKYVFTFKVADGKLTGKANAEVNGEKRETELQEGKVSGETVTFVENLKFQDNDLRIEYTGKINGEEISFKRKVADFATEDFVAKRNAPTAAEKKP